MQKSNIIIYKMPRVNTPISIKHLAKFTKFTKLPQTNGLRQLMRNHKWEVLIKISQKLCTTNGDVGHGRCYYIC